MCFPSDFVLQHSSDGLSWTDIPGTSHSDYQCADTTSQKFRFESVISDQYFRLYANKLTPDSFGNYYCQIAEMTLALDTTVGIEISRQTEDPGLLQNYPNPFYHSTTISYSLQKSTHVSLVVYDILGHHVADLINEVQTAGLHSIQWDASQLTGHKGGYYFVRLTTEGKPVTRKMLRIH